MNANLPTISSSDVGDLYDPTRPVLANLVSVDMAHRIEPHHHQRGQLIYASHGSLQIQCMGPVFMVPSQFAAWIPPGMVHSVSAGTPIDYCSLFVDPSVNNVLPRHSQLLHLTTILKELTKTAADNVWLKRSAAYDRLNRVILDQLQILKPARVALPIPHSPRMHKLVVYFLKNPGDSLDLEFWSVQLSMSVRSLTRNFKNDTGLTLRQWLQHLKVLKAIELLEAGETVKMAAFEVGYQQPSAFISMFKKITGQTPTEYVPT